MVIEIYLTGYNSTFQEILKLLDKGYNEQGARKDVILKAACIQ